MEIDKIQELRKKYNITPLSNGTQETVSDRLSFLKTGVPAEERKPFMLPGQKTAQDIATGFSKGGISTIGGLAKFGKGIATTLGGLVGIKDKGGSDKIISDIQEASTPQGTAENIGFTAEKIAEFFIPASKAMKAEKAVNVMAQGIKSPLGAALTRIGGKTAVQGTSAGLVGLAQTGEIKEAAKTAASAGAIRGGMAIIGEGARALHIPERLYSMIFKNSKNDMIAELKSGGLAKLQRENPERFQEFIKKGIINVADDGSPALNETLAERAIDKGLRGSIKNMANEVVEGTLNSEDEARMIARNYKGTVNISEPQIKNVLKEIADEYQNVGFGEISDEAASFVSKIEKTAGKVSGEDALGIRRLLDRARIARSFDVQASKLSLSQQNLKKLSDVVRGRLNQISIDTVTPLQAEETVRKSIVELQKGYPELAQKLSNTKLDLSRVVDKTSFAEELATQIGADIGHTNKGFTSSGNIILKNLNEVTGQKTMGEVMKNYSFYIEAMEALGKEAQRRGNNQVLSLIDSLFLSGAYAGNNPIPGLTMGTLRRILMSAPGLTGLGSMISKSTVSPLTSGLVSAGSSGVQSALTNQ